MFPNLYNAAYQNQANTGTAVVGDVLAGKTFNSAAGKNLTGTMVNRGQLNWNPTSNSTMSIQPGYYSGGTLNSANAYNAGYEKSQSEINQLLGDYSKIVITDYTTDNTGNIEISVDFEPSVVLLYGLNNHGYESNLVYVEGQINVGIFSHTSSGTAVVRLTNLKYYNKLLSFKLHQDSYGTNNSMYAGNFNVILIK